MTFPLFGHDLFGGYTGYVVGTLVGIAFGFTLERGGFGSARILTAQFYLTNMRVLKVMFSASRFWTPPLVSLPIESP